MSSSPDRELLSQNAARQLLERAGEIDSESTSVDTLRAAAREAGISDAAFEAALDELRGRMASQSTTRPRRSVRGIAFGAVAAVLLLAVAVFVVIPARVPVRPDAAVHEFTVQCLPLRTAADIAHRTLGPDAEFSLVDASRVMRVRSTADEFANLQKALADAARDNPTCAK